MRAVRELRIAADHPSLAGHFPGRPIVPGVVLLGAVEAFACELIGPGARLATVVAVKFLRPILPEEPFEIALETSGSIAAGAHPGTTVKFTLARAGAPLASGTLRYDA